MNTIIKKIDKTYGGYDYVEFNETTKEYYTGNSRAHRGHEPGQSISVTVNTLRQLTELETELDNLGFTNKGVK